MTMEKSSVKGNLVYRSIESDRGLRTLSLITRSCLIYYYREYELSQFDELICELLSTQELNCLKKDQLGYKLGFDVIHDPSIDSFYDKAEATIFATLLKDCIDWGLITEIGDLVQLTSLGLLSIKTKKKYRFFKADTESYEFQGLRGLSGVPMLSSKCCKELGIALGLNKQSSLSYKEISANVITASHDEEFVSLLQQQAPNDIIIYQAEPKRFIGNFARQLDVELFDIQGAYHLCFSYQDEECTELNEICDASFNASFKDRKVEWALYSKILNDPDAILNYATLAPFEDIFEVSDFIADKRIVWSDKQLLNLIISYCSADDWANLSKYCDPGILEQISAQYVDKLDWGQLTVRLNDQFLQTNSSKFPWETKLLVARESVSPTLITHFLETYDFPEGKDDDNWDWDEVIPIVGFDFVEQHINDIPFNLSAATQTVCDEVKELIVKFPQATWDWTYITTNYPLPYIIENITRFAEFLGITHILRRIFTDDVYAAIGAASEELKATVKNLHVEEYYNANTSPFLWSDCVISFFESTNLISWKSTNYISGFVRNGNLIWNYDFFSKYHSRLNDISDSDYDFLSANIVDISIVESYPTFNWNWTKLSKNCIVYNNANFVQAHLDKIDALTVLLNCDSDLVQDYYFILNANHLMSENSAVCSKVTESVPIDFIRSHIKDNWDWQLLTQRVYGSINISIIGNDIWRDKWDWAFLSSQLPIEDVLQYAQQYADKWAWKKILERLYQSSLFNDVTLNMILPILFSNDTHNEEWQYLSEKLPIDSIISLAESYTSRWSWATILNRMTSQDLTQDRLKLFRRIFDNDDNIQSYFAIITAKYETAELVDLIEQYTWTSYPWDLINLYSRSDFNAKSYLTDHHNSINWDLFSASESVNRLFKFNKSATTKSLWLRIFKEEYLLNQQYHWNFFELTKLSNIISEPRFFELEQDWDWLYISQHAKWIFTSTDDEKRSNYFFKKYSKYLSFELLSSREDIGLTEDVIRKYNKSKQWDWEALVLNPSVVYSLKFIEDFIDKPWDWKRISMREDLNCDFVESHRDKDWDWYLVSSKSFFSPSVEMISYIISLGDSINWDYISTNQNLGIETIRQYCDSINWNLLITSNPSLEQLFDNSVLNEFESLIPWDKYNQRIGNKIDNALLERFPTRLNWSNVSDSQYLDFTVELVRKYEAKWVWSILFRNPKFKEDIPEYKTLFASYTAVASFVSRLSEACHGSTPHIYHFTHLYNAIDIIRSRKILSRDRAEELGLLRYDSAGSVVTRSNLAHPYARFYFRPCTPTQYYNEALGADSQLGYYNKRGEWKSKYPKAVGLGLPKCPIPVFFRFDLEEVLSAMPNQCFYSDRNMQSNCPNVYSVIKQPSHLGVAYLYSTMQDAFNKAIVSGDYNRAIHLNEIDKVMRYSQQEFLIESEFDFSNINSLQIICYDDEYTQILHQIFASDPICKKIVSANEADENMFENENRRINLRQQISTFTLQTNFQDNYYFKISSSNLADIYFDFSSAKVLTEKHNELTARGIIRWETTATKFDIYFVDPNARTKEWLVYSNSDTPIIQSSRFILNNETKQSLEDFEDRINGLPLTLSKDLFYPHMLNSYHGIGHTSRVLLISFLLASSINLSDEEIVASCVAAITHDIGKRSDIEGASHGYSSMLKIQDRIGTYIHDTQLARRVLNAVRYHSVEDKDCPNDVRTDVIWKLLKDADALDRSRFMQGGCDKSYLRLGIYNTETGQNILDLASYLPSWTQSLKWDEPYQELIQQVNKYCE